MSTLLDKLQWRYAAKKMDATKVVPQDKVERIIEAARLAPRFKPAHMAKRKLPKVHTCWCLLRGTPTPLTAST
jgi:hypothetical protein